MTIEMLRDELNRLLKTYPSVADFPVVMAGHDANGERLYNIAVDDAGLDSSDGVLRLWDN
jgi:hypothetical protein